MKRIIGLLVLIFVISLGISTPANYLYSTVEDQIQGMQLTQINGSIWHGSAELSIEGLETGAIEWHFSPTTLLTGGLGWNFTLADQAVTGHAAAKVWQLSSLSALTITTSTQALSQWNPVLNTITSDVSADLKHISAEQCNDTSGEIRLERTSVIGLPLGSIDVQVQCEGENYSATFNNRDSPITLTGKALLTPNGGYQLNAQLQSNEPALQQQLSSLLGGSPSDQRFTIRERGNL